MTHYGKMQSHVRCMVFTVSDTRKPATDQSGDTIVQALQKLGHQVVHRTIIPDELEGIRSAVLAGVESGQTDVIILTGGTGLAKRDITSEAVEPLYTRSLPGFGEVFRQLSYAEIGARAILSRATAGVIARVLVFTLPGSVAGVRLGMDKLIVEVLPHAVELIRG